MALKVGYDLFAGASQAGTNSGVPGVIQVETAKALSYHCRIQRLSDNQYYNASTKAFQAGAPAQSLEITIPGSDEVSPSAIRRLMLRIPKEAQDGITTAGAVYTVYADGDTPAGGVAMTIVQQP